MVGRDLQWVHTLGLHVPQEVHEIAAVGFDRMVRQQRITDPGHQSPGGGGCVAAGGLQGPGQEGFDLGRRRRIPLQEVAPLGHQGGAGRAGSASVARTAGSVVSSIAICPFLASLLVSTVPPSWSVAGAVPMTRGSRGVNFITHHNITIGQISWQIAGCRRSRR